MPWRYEPRLTRATPGRRIAAAILLGAALAPSSSHGQAPNELKSLSVELPESDRAFPPGPGVETVTNNCLTCHSAGMILTQPQLTKAAWAAEVNKMINIYKAPVPPEDVGPIVDYLSQLDPSK